MDSGWQNAWTFRIVDQDTGAAVPGVPVTVLPEGSSDAGYWVSDADGLVRIPKHDRARLQLRVGLRNEEAIEFDARLDQSVHELAVTKAALADGSIDANDPQTPKLTLADAPIVEGAVMAATEAWGGASLEDVRRTAEELSPQ